MRFMTPFRLEFLVPGGAVLLASAWLVTVAFDFPVIQRVLATFAGADMRTAHGLVAVLAIAGLAYVVGVLVVMLTFRWPTRRIQRAVLEAKLEAVQDLRDALGVRLRGSILGDALREVRTTTQPLDIRQRHIDLIFSAARAAATEAVFAEFVYRRNVRQVTAGLIPALYVATAALFLWLSREVELLGWAPQTISLAVGFLFATLIQLKAIKPTIQYQEKVALGLMIDTALYAAEQDAQQLEAHGREVSSPEEEQHGCASVLEWLLRKVGLIGPA